jgi:glycosyltransferase involved in cell wall biosynthesis
MNKLLTIVVPTYNMEKYLRRCLDSLKLEDHDLFETLEVLVINDGSKDSSSAIAHEYQDKYPNVFCVIDKENGNYGSCVNRGIREASGKYFRILDADDWYNTEALEVFLDKLKNIGSDVVFTMHQVCYSNGKVKTKNVKGMPADISYFEDYDFISSDNTSLLSMHSITYRTDFLRASGLRHQEGISYTDIEFCYFPLTSAKTFFYIDVYLYNYFIGREGQTVTKEAEIRHYNDFYLICRRIVPDYIKECASSSLNRKKMLVQIMSSPLINLLYIQLVYKKAIDPYQLEKMKDVVSFVKRDDLLSRLIRYSTYRKIPFFLLWEKYNIRLGAFIGK